MSLDPIIAQFSQLLKDNHTAELNALDPKITDMATTIFNNMPDNQKHCIHLFRPIYYNPQFPELEKTSLILTFPSSSSYSERTQFLAHLETAAHLSG